MWNCANHKSGSAGQNGGSLSERALIARVAATGGSSESLIVGVTNVGTVVVTIAMDYYYQIKHMLTDYMGQRSHEVKGH